jgi:hypothetical protein
MNKTAIATITVILAIIGIIGSGLVIVNRVISRLDLLNSTETEATHKLKIIYSENQQIALVRIPNGYGHETDLENTANIIADMYAKNYRYIGQYETDRGLSRIGTPVLIFKLGG